MQVITNLDDLMVKIAECNDALTYGSDDAMRQLFDAFRLDLSAQMPADPFSPKYREFQMTVHERVTGRRYSLESERTLFLVENFRRRPFPWYLKSTATAGNHMQAIGLLLRSLDLPAGSRVAEFGPGWGNTTLALAMLGMRVTAVDVEPNFCEVLRERATHEEVELDVVEADFFWAERVAEPFDAAVFFECFHHCDDHMRLLRALRTAVKPDGVVILASEPIIEGYPIPWGVRTDGEALWAMRNFGWLELGFNAGYFREALTRTGWSAVRHNSSDMPHAAVWVLRQSEMPSFDERRVGGESLTLGIWTAPTTTAEETALRLEAAALRRELATVRDSTSWRLTAPLRRLKRLVASR